MQWQHDEHNNKQNDWKLSWNEGKIKNNQEEWEKNCELFTKKHEENSRNNWEMT